jgi:hypothetical protein
MFAIIRQRTTEMSCVEILFFCEEREVTDRALVSASLTWRGRCWSIG